MADDLTVAEAALLLAPSHALTRDEKLQRRRLQYKLHQRRHRARQQQHTTALATDVQRLRREVDALTLQWQRLLRRSAMVPVRSIGWGSAPSQVAMAYMRQFEFGLQDPDTQEQFLRSIMTANVSGPDYQGIDELLYQWQLYGRFFHRTQYIPDGVKVIATGDDMTVVSVRVVLVIRARREGVRCLYPRIRNDETAIQAMVGNAIHIPGVLRFVFDGDGTCSWFGTDMDFVAGLQRVLGDLSKVALCMEDANMSFCTGQITSSRHVEPLTSGVRV